MAATTTNNFLSTIFTPPPACSSRSFTLVDNPVGSATLLWDANLRNHVVSCTPSEWLNANPYLTETVQLYQPGINGLPGVCPSDYTTIATQPGYGGTIAFCCPPGFDYNSSPPKSYLCQTQLAAGATINVEAQASFLGAYSFVSSTVIPTPIVAYDRGISVSWGPSDLPNFTPASAPILGAASKLVSCWAPQALELLGTPYGTTTVACSLTTTFVPPPYKPNPSEPKPRLPGAYIGAIVGSILGFLLTMGLTIFIWWKCFFQPVHRLARAQEALVAQGEQRAIVVEQVTPVPSAAPVTNSKQEGYTTPV
jgi:hypothetical protein